MYFMMSKFSKVCIVMVVSRPCSNTTFSLSFKKSSWFLDNYDQKCISGFRLLYILTCRWVLCTGCAGQNMLFCIVLHIVSHIFCLILMKERKNEVTKIKKHEKIWILTTRSWSNHSLYNICNCAIIFTIVLASE